MTVLGRILEKLLVGGGGAKRGGELRDFEDFLKKHDGGRKFAGLMRVCDRADGTAIWVTPDSAESIEASNTTLPRAQAKIENAVALDATLNAPASSVAELLEAAGCLDKKEAFDAEDIDMEAMVVLTNDDLKELGLSMGQRKRLLHEIKGM